MAGRPKKYTVDFFPHDTNASEGKTLTILQNKFGNDGVLAWWRILERLGQSKNHYYSCQNQADWEFLLAKIHLPAISLLEILKALAELKAIDSELWGEKIIWSQNFLDRIADVYRNRGQEIPSKPHILSSNDTADELSVVENTQTKLNKTKLNNIIVSDKLSKIAKCYEENIGQLTPIVSERLQLICDEYPDNWFEDAVKESVNANVRKLSYVDGILKNWQTNGRGNGHKGVANGKCEKHTEKRQTDFSVGKPLR